MENKSKYWTFLGYPESLNKDYIDILESTGIKFCISPLHDKDIDKKPHYHFIIAYSNTTTYNNIFSLTKQIGATIPKRVLDICGMYEYLYHKNNKDKAQYNLQDIKCFNGFNISNYVDITNNDKEFIKINIFNIIDNNHFTEFFQVIRYLKDNSMIEELKIFMQYAYCYDKYLTSIRFNDNI